MRSDNLKPRDIFWNTLGMLTYSAVSLLVSIVIINISGSIEGGIFSFGFSLIASVLAIIYCGLYQKSICSSGDNFYDYN